MAEVQSGPASFSASGCEPLEFADPNLTAYVLQVLGERCQSPSIVVPTLVIYAVLLLLGVAGNACTCVVIIADKSMHSPTNFYLFSLAASDIIILILGLPMELHGVLGDAYPYEFGAFVCKLRAFLIEFTSYASVTVIFAFSVERWIAICFPLRAKMFSTLGRAATVILIAWAVSFACALPMAFVVTINRLPLPDWILEDAKPLVSPDGFTVAHTEFCSMDVNQPEQQKMLIYFAFFAFFLLPAIVMMLMYGHIAYRLHTADRMLVSKNESAKSKKSTRTSRSRKSVLKVLVSVVVTFFLFWLPFHVQRLLSIYLNEHMGNVSSNIEFLSTCLFYISGYCYYSNSICNPILYNVLSENYRRAFCRTILGERLARKLLPGTSTDRNTFHSRKPSRINGEFSSMSRQSLANASITKQQVTLRQYPPELLVASTSTKAVTGTTLTRSFSPPNSLLFRSRPNSREEAHTQVRARSLTPLPLSPILDE